MYNFYFLKSNYPTFILKTEGRIDKFSCHSYLHDEIKQTKMSISFYTF